MTVMPSAVAPGAETGSGRADTLAEESVAAVRVALWASATRCLITYVVAPLLGTVGVVLGPVGLLLQVLGAITATAGARRLWLLGHRLRLPYAVVAVAVDAVALLVLVEVVAPSLVGGRR